MLRGIGHEGRQEYQWGEEYQWGATAQRTEGELTIAVQESIPPFSKWVPGKRKSCSGSGMSSQGLPERGYERLQGLLSRSGPGTIFPPKGEL